MQEGIDLFNQEKFFEAHEVWEEEWRNSKSRFMQALIFIAGAFHHYENKNNEGAILFLKKGLHFVEMAEKSLSEQTVESLKKCLDEMKKDNKIVFPKL